MVFQEFTIVGLEDGCEVMVDLDTATGKVIDLYCYVDHIPAVVNEETGRQYKIRTTAGQNPLFVHIDNKRRVYHLLLRNGYSFCGLDENDSDYLGMIRIIEKSATFIHIEF